MKGIWSWLKSSSKMKRWIFLILIGIVLTCYGIAKILVEKEMEFVDAGKIIVVFVVGFTSIVLGLIFISKRNNDTQHNNQNPYIQRFIASHHYPPMLKLQTYQYTFTNL